MPAHRPSLSSYSKHGDALFKAGKYTDAKQSYWDSAIKVVGTRYRIPGVPGSERGVRTELYTKLHPFDRANLMGCCTGIAKCFLKEGDIECVSRSCTLEFSL